MADDDEGGRLLTYRTIPSYDSVFILIDGIT
jgi:hypothetical protein